MEEIKKKRMAVLVGCNYPNTKYELRGCINDVKAMRETLVSRFGFEPSHIQMLTDEHGSNTMPTGANIRSSLERMVSSAEPGDVLLFHYSGHGTRVPSLIPGNLLRQDEAIVPSDFNLITDVDFRHLVNRVAKGASFTMVSDSCHSGGLIDKEKQQIGPSKFIPLHSILQHLPSLKFQLQDSLCDLDSLNPDAGILLSGCQANETSADISPTAGEKPYGAFSNALENVLLENPAPLSNKQLVVMARAKLKEQGFAQQHPCLYCSDDYADAPFLAHPI